MSVPLIRFGKTSSEPTTSRTLAPRDKRSAPTSPLAYEVHFTESSISSAETKIETDYPPLPPPPPPSKTPSYPEILGANFASTTISTRGPASAYTPPRPLTPPLRLLLPSKLPRVAAVLEFCLDCLKNTPPDVANFLTGLNMLPENIQEQILNGVNGDIFNDSAHHELLHDRTCAKLRVELLNACLASLKKEPLDIDEFLAALKALPENMQEGILNDCKANFDSITEKQVLLRGRISYMLLHTSYSDKENYFNSLGQTLNICRNCLDRDFLEKEIKQKEGTSEPLSFVTALKQLPEGIQSRILTRCSSLDPVSILAHQEFLRTMINLLILFNTPQ